MIHISAIQNKLGVPVGFHSAIRIWQLQQHIYHSKSGFMEMFQYYHTYITMMRLFTEIKLSIIWTTRHWLHNLTYSFVIFHRRTIKTTYYQKEDIVYEEEETKIRLEISCQLWHLHFIVNSHKHAFHNSPTSSFD